MLLTFIAMGVTKHAFDRCERHFPSREAMDRRWEPSPRIQ